MSKKDSLWLDRRIGPPAPYLALCLTEKEFDAACDDLRLSLRNRPNMIHNAWSNGTTHILENAERELAAIVCISNYEHRNPVEVAGLLVHEAVHIWQEYRARIGEKNPGSEQEAYAIQSISQELMQAFADRVKPKRKK